MSTTYPSTQWSSTIGWWNSVWTDLLITTMPAETTNPGLCSSTVKVSSRFFILYFAIYLHSTYGLHWYTYCLCSIFCGNVWSELVEENRTCTGDPGKENTVRLWCAVMPKSCKIAHFPGCKTFTKRTKRIGIHNWHLSRFLIGENGDKNIYENWSNYLFI